MRKKITAILLTVVLLVSVMSIPASAADNIAEVSLRIEGLDETIFCEVLKIDGATVGNWTLEAMLEQLGSRDDTFDIVMSDSPYGGKYITEINGISEMSNGQGSGWGYIVDGEAPSFGISDLKLADGNEIVLYFFNYLLGFQYPELDMSRVISDGIAKFTSLDTSYDDDFNVVETINPVVGATVMWGELDLVTDENGEIEVPKLAGCYPVAIEKYDEESGISLLLRLAPDFVAFVPFIDLDDGAWYLDAIEYSVDAGFFKGIGDNKFAPLMQTTMAQLLQILYNVSGASYEDGEFWYSAALEWAIASELITEEEFVQDAKVTRAEFISMFCMTAAMLDDDMTVTTDITAATDYDEIAEEYVEAMSWAVASGLIQGQDATQLVLAPNMEINRATVCQMLANYYR